MASDAGLAHHHIGMQRTIRVLRLRMPCQFLQRVLERVELAFVSVMVLIFGAAQPFLNDAGSKHGPSGKVDFLEVSFGKAIEDLVGVPLFGLHPDVSIGFFGFLRGPGGFVLFLYLLAAR